MLIESSPINSRLKSQPKQVNKQHGSRHHHHCRASFFFVVVVIEFITFYALIRIITKNRGICLSRAGELCDTHL